MSTIEHNDILDIRTLGRELAEIAEVASAERDLDQDQTIEALRDLASELYIPILRVEDIEDEDVADVAENLGISLQEAKEQQVLEALADDLEAYGENHEPILVHEDYFVDYAEQVAIETGAISDDASWPLNHIDWDAAANALREDYRAVHFDGNRYLILQG